MGNADLIKCSNCGEMMDPESTFCTNCGSRLEKKTALKECASCGQTMELQAVFCSRCGSRYEDKDTSRPTPETSSLESQLMALANEFLSVKKISPERFEFSSQIGAQSPLQKVKVSYEAVVQLDPGNKRLTFWEKMVESSAGFDAGSSSERAVQKGSEVGKKIHGHLLFGGKYGFEYGKLRDVVKAIAGEQGWEFKTLLFAPKVAVGSLDEGPKNSWPIKKILFAALILLSIVIFVIIGRQCASNDSSQKLSPDKVENSSQNQAVTPLLPEHKILPKSSPPAVKKKLLIETDQDTYHRGERVKVRYYRAPGSSRDWICIVPAGSHNTEAGDYQYIPERGQGVMTFDSPSPGEYEARAFYNYSPGEYKITARYKFTVE
jgi:hypothetical protein